MSQLLSVIKSTTKFLLIFTLVFLYCSLYIVIVLPIWFFYILDSNQTAGERFKSVLASDSYRRRKEKKQLNGYLNQSTKPLKKIFLLSLNLFKKI